MLEKTVLQQLQEIFPMEVNREEADAGEKIRLRNDEQKVEIDFILDGHLEQGYGYKNFKAYNRDVYETSYISEYGYEEYKKQIQEAINHYNKNEFTLEELADSVKEAEKDNGYSHKDFLVLTNYQEEISSHLFDAVDWQYPDTLFDEWIDGNEINKIGNKYIFTAGMELNDFLKMEYLKDFQQGNVNILGVDGKKYISLEDLVNFDVDRYSEKCLNVVYENEKRESQSIDKNLISFNSCTFEINLDSKDNGEGCLKWHNYFLTDIHNKDHFYIIQIVQETGKEEPRFSLEKFEKEEGSKLYLGEWVELEDVIKNSSEIEMVQNKLIELSDKEIGIQNEEIKNIEDDFEELDEVEK